MPHGILFSTKQQIMFKKIPLDLGGTKLIIIKKFISDICLDLKTAQQPILRNFENCVEIPEFCVENSDMIEKMIHAKPNLMKKIPNILCSNHIPLKTCLNLLHQL